MDISPVVLPKYKDATYQEALAEKYDLLQLKYDGWNARIEIHFGWVTWYSKTGRKYAQICYPDTELHAVIYAEHMFGTQWGTQPEREGQVWCHDLYAIDEQPVAHMQYRERYSLLRSITNRLPEKFSVVQSYPMEKFAEVWKDNVLSGPMFEGVVFKRRHDPLNGVIFRQKQVVTEDLQVIGFKEGTNRLTGMLGALIGRTKAGVLVDVGGGLEDVERFMIWTNPDKYMNRWFEAEARGRFESGSLRHPNFIRWRDDL